MNNYVVNNTEVLFTYLAERFLNLSLHSQPAHISLSGGSTPRLLFKFIAASDYAQRIKWQKLHLWWGDERCVPPNDLDSNYGQCKHFLLDHIMIPEINIHRIRGEDAPEQEVIRYTQALNQLVPQHNNLPQFDWVLLGMGEDGHTASLFPEAFNVQDDHLMLLATHPTSKQLRISKSAQLIAHSRRVTYLILGESKANMVQLINQPDINKANYPAAIIHALQGTTEYYLDAAAAKYLPACLFREVDSINDFEISISSSF